MNYANLSFTAEYCDFLFGFDSDKEIIHNVPYLVLESEFVCNELTIPLAVAFVDGSPVLCFKYPKCLRAASFFNDSFVDPEALVDFLFSK